jgi:putative addiction module antidote
MVELKIQKIGDSLGVILPPDVVERLQLHEGQTLYASNGPNGTVSISLVAPDRRDVMAVAEDLANRYHETLKALAK